MLFQAENDCRLLVASAPLGAPLVTSKKAHSAQMPPHVRTSAPSSLSSLALCVKDTRGEDKVVCKLGLFYSCCLAVDFSLKMAAPASGARSPSSSTFRMTKSSRLQSQI